jgi:hypothetical protein
MTSKVFESYLALAEQDPSAGATPSPEERAVALEDRIAAHTAIFAAMERRIGDEGIGEPHRPLIPLFQRWMHGARQLVAQARDTRAAGRPIRGVDELVCAINDAKVVAERFDQTVQVNDRLRRGEPPGPSRPLGEVWNEIRAGDRTGR